MAYNWLGQYDQATAPRPRSRGFDLDPAPSLLAYAELGIACVQQGRTDEAIARLNRALELGQNHPSVRGTLGYALATAGKRPDAALKVVEILAAVALDAGSAFALPIARILAALGEDGQCLSEWLSKACGERTPFVIWLKIDPTFDRLRQDPRFSRMLRDMGLPP